jgi:hypothetical protein
MSARKQLVKQAIETLTNCCHSNQLTSNEVPEVELLLEELERLRDQVSLLETKNFLRKPVVNAKTLKPGFYELGDGIKLVIK